MEQILSDNVGNTAEVIFSLYKQKEKVIGRIAGVLENTLVLETNRTLAAGEIENILFIRIFKNDTNSAQHSEPQAASTELLNTSQNGKIIVSSLNSPVKTRQSQILCKMLNRPPR